MSNIWSSIEVPEQVQFKDIIQEQILRSVKEKCTVNLDKNVKDRITNKSKKNYTGENEIMAKMLEIKLNLDNKKGNVCENKESEYIQDATDEEILYNGEMDDDFNITNKGHWEKYDCSERFVIPYEKPRPQELRTVRSKFFEKNKAIELLLNFPEMQLYKPNPISLYACTMTQLVHAWEEEREKKFHTEFSDALDPFTLDLINKMIYDDFLVEVDAIISSNGTESVVLHARSSPNYFGGNENFPKELALKVFKKNLFIMKPAPDWKNFNAIREQANYHKAVIKNFSRRGLTRQATRELEILRRVRFAGIRCPEPIYHNTHIVVMSFIGEDKIPAPKLTDANLNAEEYETAYNEIIDVMKVMFQKLHLIHAGFLENDVLWFKNHCYFTDFSKVVKSTEEDACDYLWYDCKTLTDFFKGKKIPDILAHDELFYFVTGFDYFEEIRRRKK